MQINLLAQERPYTLVYDGTCGVCGQFVSLVERWDSARAITTVPSQNARVPVSFPWIPAEAYADAIQLIGPGGRTWQGAAAVEQLLAVVPRGWVIGWIFRLPAARWLADRFYRWFARNRYRFGCGKHCGIRPTKLVYPAIAAGDATMTKGSTDEPSSL